MYFQLEVDYYSNEANKNKYKNFQLIASTKNNLKIAEKQIVQGIYLQRREIDNEVRISEATEMRRKFNRYQKRVTP